MVNEERIKELKLLLKDIFQFENKDLDFGIYRIINLKKKEISEFIDHELFEIISEGIKTVDSNTEVQKNLEALKKEIESTFGCDIQQAKTKYAETPKVKDYLNKEEELKIADKENDIEEEIYDDIINFFSRYYDKGDFISKRRYSKENKYAIPYNGEEVYLYWANNDQYYIKTAENFKTYSFKAGDIKVDFEIVSEDVDVEKNNIKDSEKKFFIFNDAEYEPTKKFLQIKFGYRGLTSDEEEAISEIKDKRRIGKDEVNQYNLQKIQERIGIYGLSNLQKKHIKMDGEKSESSQLEWHLNKYTTKSTSDYFIHKDLKKFLTQELDFYIKNELLHLDDIDSRDDLNISLNRVKVCKQISLKIIDFLAQVENFQKKLWEKKKFVTSTDYCITLDYINEMYYSEILRNKDQLEEWKKLYSFDIEEEVQKLKGKLIVHGMDDDKETEILKQNPTLVIDTKFYDTNFKYQILSGIDDLDNKTTGVLINSENYQALNLIQNKYENKIKCCYTDPPYNTGKDGFRYKDGYKSSSWLALMYDRVKLFSRFLEPDGVSFTSIDDNEIQNLVKVFDEIYLAKNRLANFVWRTDGNFDNQARIKDCHEYILCYAKDEAKFPTPAVIDPNIDEKSKLFKNIIRNTIVKNGPKNPISEVILPIGFPADFEQGTIKKRNNSWPHYNTDAIIEKSKLKNEITVKSGWSSKELLIDFIDSGFCEVIDTKNQKTRFIINETGTIDVIKERSENQSHVISVLSNLGNTQSMSAELKNMGLDFEYPKPTKLIKYLCSLVNASNASFVDFFAGSGTTGHAVLNLNKEDGGNRKFILVEMGQYFDTILKPRILKVIYSDNWKNGKSLDNDGSKKQIIKYQTLEQYEDSLNNIDFKEPNKLALESKDYKIKYMLDFESRDNNVFLNLDALSNPFEYKLKVENNNEMKELNIDLIETFNYIAGIDVKSIQKKQDQKIDYIIVKGQRNEKEVIVIWRNISDAFDPKQDKEFVQKEILTEEYDEILVNGNSLIPDAKSVDEIFKANMFGGYNV